jgi:hypothetical protein
VEAFMAFESILPKRREIKQGPGAKGFDIGRISDDPHPMQISVRGLTSECDCPIGNRCSYCEKETPVWLLIVGTFNPDLHQRDFVFWGYINRDAQGDALRRAPCPVDGERVSSDPSRSELVYGWYTPYPGRGKRGWIAPMRHNLDELFRMFYGTSDLRRTFAVIADGIENTELPKWRGRVPPLHPDILWGMCQRHERIRLRLRHVERQVSGYGIFTIVGIEPLHDEGCPMELGPISETSDEPQWTRFKIRLDFYPEDRTGDEHETYRTVWVDVREDGHWNYIWAQEGDRKVSWVHWNSP